MSVIIILGVRITSCYRCGRPLSDPRSVERGYGPTCAKLAGISGVRSPRIQPEPHKEWYKRFFSNSLVQTALTHACITSLSVTMPGVGLAIATAYTYYNYTSFGYTMFKAFQELQKGGQSRQANVAQSAAANVTGFAMSQGSDNAANYIVNKAKEAGHIKELAASSKIDDVVLTDMLKGTTSQAIDNGFSELAKFGAKKIIGV